jgi:transaldolase
MVPAVRNAARAAHATFETLSRIGVSIEEVANTLEGQGIASFAKSWDELIDSVARQIEKAGAVVLPAGAVKPVTAENG